MIRHRPAGRGHPYLVEPDQRVPLRPANGPLELRATTRAGAVDVIAELELAGTRRAIAARLRGDAVPDPLADWGVPAPRVDEDGHLADAVARLGEQRGRSSWAVDAPTLSRGERLRYRFVGDGGATRWHEVKGCSWEPVPAAVAVDAPSPATRARIDPGRVEQLTDGELVYAVRFAVDLHPGERVVGFGERFDSLDQRGKRVDVAVFDQYKGQGARTYIPMPFAIVAGGGFGFHVDTGHRVRFDVGCSDPDRILVEVDLEPGAPAPSVSLRLFEGCPADVLGAFLESTGMPEAPPAWVYRLWMSGNEWNTQARIEAEVARSEAEGIPVGAIVIEAWSDETTFVAFNGAVYAEHADGSPHRLADFTFPPDGPWPDPQGMVDELHRRDVKVLLWQIPLVQSTVGQAGADRRVMIERDLCVRLADGRPYRNRGWWFPGALMPDFTSEAACRWWTAKRRYLLDEIGIDGFKTDGGEHAWGTDLVYADGTDGGETNNRFPVLYGRAYHRLLRESRRDGVTFSRAGFTGSAAVPCHWAGDEDSTWDAYRASITAGVTAGASGLFFWGWDIGGFSGQVPDPELYLRATAMACFCPIMQYHSEYNHHRTPSRDRTPWNVAERTGDARVIPLFRQFVALRERLVPYLVEQGERAIADRKPLLRAPFFESDDPELWRYPLQYFLGDALVVAPVTEPGVDRWQLYAPDGQWVEPWSGEEFGPGLVELAAPLDRIPVLVAAERAHEILPLFAPPSAHELLEVS